MCGVWGVSDMGADITHQTLVKIIKKLMILSETRGKDASGIAVMQDDRLCVLRKAKSSHELLKDIEFIRYLEDNVLKSASGNIWITGHSRLVTNGTQYNPYNNQPIAKKHMALVHNGIIVNEEELWSGLPEDTREYEVDSEAVLETIHDQYMRSGSIREAAAKAFKQIRGMASVICLMQEGHHMVAASNNGSLYQCGSRDGKLVIFASESLMLKRLIYEITELGRQIDENSIRQIMPGMVLDISDGHMGVQKEIEITQDAPTGNSSPDVMAARYADFEIDFDKIRKIRRCTKCVLPETMPFIEFDDNGVCNYCRGYHKAEYKGIGRLREWNKEYTKKSGKAMVSFSGGRDSSYGLHYFVKEMGIKPIAYCYDWGMVTDIARRNQSRMCEQLGIEFILVSADIKKKRKNIRKSRQKKRKKK